MSIGWKLVVFDITSQGEFPLVPLLFRLDICGTRPQATSSGPIRGVTSAMPRMITTAFHMVPGPGGVKRRSLGAPSLVFFFASVPTILQARDHGEI